MHISISSHQTKAYGISSRYLVDYLEKENLEKKQEIQESHRLSKESFFSQDSIENPALDIDKNDIIVSLDKNRGSRKLKESNYYMLNISPSKKELEHMESIAIKELESRGIQNKRSTSLYYLEQKEGLIKHQLKLYTNDVIQEYAKSMNRSIYCYEDKLPNAQEKKSLEEETEKKFSEFLKEKGIAIKEEQNRDKEAKENKDSKWIDIDAKILEEKEKSQLIEIKINKEIKGEVYVPKSMLQIQKDGSYKMPEALYHTKINELEAKKLVAVDGKIIKEHEKSYLLEIKINQEIKGEVYVPKTMLQVQKEGSYKMPDTLYQSKIKELVHSKYSQEKQKIYDELAINKGFDLSKRSLSGDDLLWYGKVEQSRTYKWSDTAVKYNDEVEKKITIEKSEKERVKLSKELLRDKDTGEVIREGSKKGGSQYHVHVIVSRHDKTMQNSKNKVSLSPLANAKDSKIAKQGAQVGFIRDVFYQKCESVFDNKFDYKRQVTYEHYKQRKNHLKELRSLNSEGKRFLMKHTGVNKIKQELLPIQNIKDQLGISNISTSFPTSITKEAIKVVRKIIDKGLEY